MLSVHHNALAMYANLQLNKTKKSQEKRMERLSSGYRINRAADDAANLAISEKMTLQIRGLNQSLKNIQNGISACNVADGALNEVHDILQRMRELAVEGANGTYTDDDRTMLDDEIQQLKSEIEHIGKNTEYNTKPLFTGGVQTITTTTTTTTTLEKPTATSVFFQLLGSDVSSTCYMQEELTKDMVTNSTSQLDDPNDTPTPNPYVSVHIEFKNIINSANNQIQQLIGTGFYVNCCTKCCASRVTFTDEIGFSKKGDEISWGIKKADGSYYNDASEFVAAIVASGTDSSHVEFANKDSILYLYDIDNNSWTQTQKEDAYFCDKPETITNTVTSTVESEQTSLFGIQMSHRAYDFLPMAFGELSPRSLKIENVNLRTQQNCMDSLNVIRKATSILSAQRSNIGAYSNRLEHSYANNSNVIENTESSISRIRDTDMAKESVALAKDNILQQVSQAMISQANQSADYVLDLLSL